MTRADASVKIPAWGREAARTVTYQYAVGGNPLITSVGDAAGPVTTTVDLLGRAVTYNDVWGQASMTTTTRRSAETQAVEHRAVGHHVVDLRRRRCDADGAQIATVTSDRAGDGRRRRPRLAAGLVA